MSSENQLPSNTYIKSEPIDTSEDWSQRLKNIAAKSVLPPPTTKPPTVSILELEIPTAFWTAHHLKQIVHAFWSLRTQDDLVTQYNKGSKGQRESNFETMLNLWMVETEGLTDILAASSTEVQAVGVKGFIFVSKVLKLWCCDLYNTVGFI